MFRRTSRRRVLCDDSRAFNAEAQRRVRVSRDMPWNVGDGDRILILGEDEDEDGKTDDLKQILVPVDYQFSQVNGQRDDTMAAVLLAPLSADDDDDEEVLSKNNSSTILRFSLACNGIADKCRFLTRGDAEDSIWRSFGSAMRRMRIGCRTTDCYRRTIAPGTACPTIAGVRCARMPRCRRMPAIRSPRLAAERRSSPAAIRSRVTTTTRAKATVLPFMHPSKDRRSRCRCPRSRGHCASPPPSHGTGRWRQSGSPPVRQGGLRNGAGR